VESVEATLAEAQRLYRQDRWRDALMLVEDATERWPEEPELWFRAGLLACILTEPEQSRHFTSRAAELAADDPDIRVQCACVLFRIGDVPESAELLQGAVSELDEDSPQILNAAELAASLLEQMGPLDAAEEAYRTLLEDLPSEAGQALARICLASGRRGDARAAVDEALRIDPDDPPLKRLRQELATEPRRTQTMSPSRWTRRYPSPPRS
jgi:tetratricopeptide (TPR) repeat protein